ncbi:hypothetical protein DFH29DRAFT_777539, partial [Suillus ampliporus]
VIQVTAPPMRQRQVSTESKESKKKPGGFLGGLFRTMSGSSKPLESPVASSPKISMEQHKSPAIVAPPVQHSKSSSSAKEPKDKTVASAIPSHMVQTPAIPSTSASVQRKAPKTKARAPEITIPSAQPTRDRKQPSTNVFSPFSFLSSKRIRTMSGASLDVCDGNTATNTVIGSPNQSAISQNHPLPPIVPPPARDPMVATSQW